MIRTLDGNGKITGWILRKAGCTRGLHSGLIGKAHSLTVTPDEKTIYVADFINAKVVKLEHNGRRAFRRATEPAKAGEGSNHSPQSLKGAL